MGHPDDLPGKDDVMTGSGVAAGNGSLGETSTDMYHLDPKKERKMMRKFDVRTS
jgi:hypothetical protein